VIPANHLKALTAYANDDHPRVSEEEVERAVTEIENRYGVDFEDAEFTEAMENEAIALAVEHRTTHEADWFDGSERAFATAERNRESLENR
jgi:hypothetical protein